MDEETGGIHEEGYGIKKIIKLEILEKSNMSISEWIVIIFVLIACILFVYYDKNGE